MNHGTAQLLALSFGEAMIALLSGAKRNVGDFLITEHARCLLEMHRGEDVRWFPNWEPLDSRIGELAQASAMVLAGGPGLRRDMYGRVYPLFESPDVLMDLEVPLVFLGSGWKALLGDPWDLRHTLFDEKTRGLLRKLGKQAVFSARDELSLQMLIRNGVSDAVMTGCPVWYEPTHLGTPPCLPERLERIVFTEPRGGPALEAQSLKLLRALRDAYPAAEIVASFHHGFEGIEAYVETASAMGVQVRDVAGDTSKISFYDDFDLHVGYRVHAGLYFLSRRKPSIIVCEDARGIGAAKVLGVPWLPAWRYRAAGVVPRRLLPYGKVERKFRRFRPYYEARGDVSADVLRLLRRQLSQGWYDYSGVGARIDAQYEVMTRFIKTFGRGA